MNQNSNRNSQNNGRRNGSQQNQNRNRGASRPDAQGPNQRNDQGGNRPQQSQGGQQNRQPNRGPQQSNNHQGQRSQHQGDSRRNHSNDRGHSNDNRGQQQMPDRVVSGGVTFQGLSPHEAELLIRYKNYPLEKSKLMSFDRATLEASTVFFETFADARLKMSEIAKREPGTFNIVIKQEGDMKDPELVRYGVVYAGAAWWLIYGRRKEENVLKKIVM